MKELNQRRLLMIRQLLDDLTFYTDDEVSGSEREALCINISDFRLYPTFQFNEDIQIHEQLRKSLDTLRIGRSDVDAIAWLLTEKTVIMERAVAPADMVRRALESGDLEAHDELVSAEARQSRYLTAKPIELIGSSEFDVFVDDWLHWDERVIPKKDIELQDL